MGASLVKGLPEAKMAGMGSGVQVLLSTQHFNVAANACRACFIEDAQQGCAGNSVVSAVSGHSQCTLSCSV